MKRDGAMFGAGIAMILTGVILLCTALGVAAPKESGIPGGDGTPFLATGIAMIVTGAALVGYAAN